MSPVICQENPDAIEKLPAKTGDKSGIGVHYVDAYVKPMNVTLEDGTKVACKRRGLKVTLTVGEKKGDGLMRFIENGPDPIVMLQAALREAAEAAGVNLKIENGEIAIDC